MLLWVFDISEEIPEFLPVGDVLVDLLVLGVQLFDLLGKVIEQLVRFYHAFRTVDCVYYALLA
jgi:hypothetical protein